jgi:hypothetical protein
MVLVVAAPLLAGVLDSLNNLYFDPAFAKDNHKAWSQFLRERLRPDDYLLLVAPHLCSQRISQSRSSLVSRNSPARRGPETRDQ